MALITLVALLLGLTASLGDLLGPLLGVLIWSGLPTPFVVGAIYGRRDLQAFSIGALIPWGMLLVTTNNPSSSIIFGRLPLISGVLQLVVSGSVCGLLAVAARRWLERNNYGG